MNLPPPLAAWAPELDLFPREMVVPLGAIARPLDALIGPLRDRRRNGDEGEPDGYADIARRGPYERLLLSEWLLASEEPDEWTRRAVAGEHSFLELSRRKPVADRLAAVLFDTGPSQWGSPRLAHLAALIVLKRRAQAVGARFAWGILQQSPPAPDAPLWSDVSAAGILRLLQGASPREATEADIAVWRGRLAGESATPASTPDLWIVGSVRLASPAAHANASLLSVQEPLLLDPAADEPHFLLANAHFGPDVAPRAVASDVRLPLPRPGICVRLLRDPFGVKSQIPTSASETRKPEVQRDLPASELIFPLHGSKLFARGGARGDTTLLSFPLGNSPAGQISSPPKQYRSQFGVPFFAAGRVGKVTILASLASDGSAVHVEALGRGSHINSGSYRLTSPFNSSTEEDALAGWAPVRERLHPILPLYHSSEGKVIALITVLPGGRLVRLDYDSDKGGTARVMGLRVSALHRTGNSIVLASITGKTLAVFLLRDPPSTGDKIVERTDDVLDLSSRLEQGAYPRVFLDAGSYGRSILVQPSSESEAATLLVSGTRKELTVPKGQRLVGISSSSESPTTPQLFLLSQDGATVFSAFSHLTEKQTPLFQSPHSPITRIARSPYAPLLAYTTEAGEVGVWSLTHRDYVYRRLAPARKAETA